MFVVLRHQVCGDLLYWRYETSMDDNIGSGSGEQYRGNFGHVEFEKSTERPG